MNGAAISGILSAAENGPPRGKPRRSGHEAMMMMRISVAFVAVLGLAACGGGSRYASSNAVVYGGGYTASSSTPQTVVKFANGPIQKACEADGRKSASRARCGCVQAVADESLSSSDQRRGAKMFRDPHQLQEIRQSDNSENERFWLAWKAFGQTAAAFCNGT